MPRYRSTRQLDDDESSDDSSFHSPTNEENQTDYNLEYTDRSRLVNPYDARATRSFARKSTSRGPHAPTRARAEKTQSEARSPPTSSRRDPLTHTRTRAEIAQSAARSPPTSSRRGPLTRTRAELEQSAARSPPGRAVPPIIGAQRRKKKPMSMEQRERRFQREVRMLQKKTTPLVPKLNFSRLVRDIIQEFSIEVTRVTPDCLAVLQEATELYLTQHLADSYLLTLHRGRITLACRDMHLLQQLRLFSIHS